MTRHQDPEWYRQLDLQAFEDDVNSLRNNYCETDRGRTDLCHLRKIKAWVNTFEFLGMGTMWMVPNPLTAMALSLGVFCRWTMLGHHISHGGYDVSKCYSKNTYAKGWMNRMLHWMDWFLPEAWDMEHNRLHHWSLGEKGADPDLVEDNVAPLRRSRLPLGLKWAVVASYICTWRWLYYATNTFNHLQLAQRQKSGKQVTRVMKHPVLLPHVLVRSCWWVPLWQCLSQTVLPFILYRFVSLPCLCWALAGWGCGRNALLNLLLAELFTNIHTFLTIVTNHCGRDVYRFGSPCTPKTGEWYVRQIVGSVNYQCGNDTVDLLHGWLNYQIEHHVWPDMSMLAYRTLQPQLKQVCKKHGVPYVQESVFTRLRKTVEVMTGQASMLKMGYTA